MLRVVRHCIWWFWALFNPFASFQCLPPLSLYLEWIFGKLWGCVWCGVWFPIGSAFSDLIVLLLPCILLALPSSLPLLCSNSLLSSYPSKALWYVGWRWLIVSYYWHFPPGMHTPSSSCSFLQSLAIFCAHRLGSWEWNVVVFHLGIHMPDNVCFLIS